MSDFYPPYGYKAIEIMEKFETSYGDQHHKDVQHQMKVELLESEQQYKRFSMLKPKIFIDGDMWCVLYGENIQDGVAGFGKTPHDAVLDWEKNWYQEPKTL